MFLTFWLMFTNGVFGLTMIVCDKTENAIVIAARSTIPFLWCFLGSFVSDQLDKQVEQIDMIIIKFLIDFRCDQARKDILQTFKQLIATNRLQFSLFMNTEADDNIEH
ncbi:hypothetical protein NE865_15622 [Phthorimaea operculella]|nr:hypothetical protein NE865_15622 [Phthorimaea operculella]